eukprot:1158558-Pelagomonas_calceolata.AAC.3
MIYNLALRLLVVSHEEGAPRSGSGFSLLSMLLLLACDGSLLSTFPHRSRHATSFPHRYAHIEAPSLKFLMKVVTSGHTKDDSACKE